MFLPRAACLVFFALMLAWFPRASAAAPALTKVTLQLKWKHQFQFAGYYMALEKGLYKEAGLEVTIVPGGPTVDVVKQVLEKKADFGVGTSALLLDFAAGKPVVVLGVVYQHSPLVLLMSTKHHIPKLRDLLGKAVMIEPHSADILAMFKMAGVPMDRIRIIPHSGTVDGLLQQKAGAITAYITDEPFLLDQAKHPYTTFSPRTYGVDFYGDNFFTRKDLLTHRPAVVASFRKATIEGWKLAISDPESAIRLIYDKYSKRKTIAHLRFEARRTKNLMTDLVTPGHMHRRRWEYIAESYFEMGFLQRKPDLNGFLYVEEPKAVGRPFKLPRWLWPALGVAFLLLLGTSLISLYLKRLNLSLNVEIGKRREAEVELKASNVSLTQALNEIKTLKGILPICMHCNKIREEGGEWQQLEQYISSRSEAEFSHGICAECAKKHYDFDENSSRVFQTESRREES